MCPHPDHLHDPLAAEDLIDEAMVDVDPAREGAGEIAEEFLKGRGRLEVIVAQDLQQGLGFGLESGAAQFLRVLDGLWGEHDPPRAHQSSDSRHSLTGVANPLRIEARIPGIERR